jgi:hypothetical protein
MSFFIPHKATHIRFWNAAKANIVGVLNDRVARTAQVHVDVMTAVHAELSTGHHNDTVLDVGNMDGAIYLPTDEQRLPDIFDGEARIGFAVGGRNGHIDNTSSQRRNRSRDGSVRCGGG